VKFIEITVLQDSRFKIRKQIALHADLKELLLALNYQRTAHADRRNNTSFGSFRCISVMGIIGT